MIARSQCSAAAAKPHRRGGVRVPATHPAERSIPHAVRLAGPRRRRLRRFVTCRVTINPRSSASVTAVSAWRARLANEQRDDAKILSGEQAVRALEALKPGPLQLSASGGVG